MTLPEWYIEWISRVSDVVSFVFPFEGDAKQRYLDWLKKVWVCENLYLTTAQEWGTYVHEQCENEINWDPIDIKNPLYKKTKPETDFWVEFYKKLKDEIRDKKEWEE